MKTRGKEDLVQKGDQRGVNGGFGFMALWYGIKYMTWKKYLSYGILITTLEGKTGERVKKADIC